MDLHYSCLVVLFSLIMCAITKVKVYGTILPSERNPSKLHLPSVCSWQLVMFCSDLILVSAWPTTLPWIFLIKSFSQILLGIQIQ